jgi:RimJ/RimL family protein N-acetyltransferase
VSNSVEQLCREVPRLCTERLVLRGWEERDGPAYQRIVGDPDVMRYMGSGLRWGLKRAAAGVVGRVSDLEGRRSVRHLAIHWQRHGFGEWAVEERGTGELIGRIGLRYHPDWVADPSKVEIGWLLTRRAWGKGYATEAARPGLGHAFARLQLDRLMSIALVDNRRSRRVMEKLGLAWQGQTHWKGSDVVWYAIDREAWEPT